jgi:hypothetical protein
MNNKGLTEEDIQIFTLKDPKNEILNLYKDNRDLFRTHYHVRVVLNNPIDPKLNFPESVLTNVITTDKEIEYL